MALREPIVGVSWGLVAQRGPWRETPNDIRALKQQQRQWVGPVGQGGTAHAGHNYWKAQVVPDRERTSFMPAPPGPSRYAQRRVVTTQLELEGGATLQRTKNARRKLKIGANPDVNDAAHPEQYPDIKVDPYDYQSGLDLKAEAIKQELGVNDDVPDLYPQAGAFERDTGMLAALEMVPDDTYYGQEANQALVNARAEETIDRMAGGSLPGGFVQHPMAVDTDELNVIHLAGPDILGRPEIVSVYTPPRHDIVDASLQQAIANEMRRQDYQSVYDQQFGMGDYGQQHHYELPSEDLASRSYRRSKMIQEHPYASFNKRKRAGGKDLDLGAVFEKAAPPRGTKRKGSTSGKGVGKKTKETHPSSKRKNEGGDDKTTKVRKTGHPTLKRGADGDADFKTTKKIKTSHRKEKPSLRINTDVPKSKGPQASKRHQGKAMDERIPNVEKRSKRIQKRSNDDGPSSSRKRNK